MSSGSAGLTNLSRPGDATPVWMLFRNRHAAGHVGRVAVPALQPLAHPSRTTGPAMIGLSQMNTAARTQMAPGPAAMADFRPR